MTCPNEERLAEYCEGRLSDKDRSRVEDHLEFCRACFDQVLLINRIAEDMDRFVLEPAPEAVTKKAIRLVSGETRIRTESVLVNLKRFVKHTGARMFDYFGVKPWAGWQFSEIRGSRIATSEDFVCLKVPFGKIETKVEIEKRKNETAHIRVKLATPVEEANVLRVTLKKEDREIASYILSDFVSFEQMPFDHYNISVFLDGVSLGTYYFTIKETRDADE